ncbi:DUF3618 domain-containing protein, partial [Dankookia sp. GCM10030260]|uniref:DUF3618 domain-containing protein n=1 Tax=Dankookia sp. GCM10030260 TaxID=3273390 RepID=UPI003616C2BB
DPGNRSAAEIEREVEQTRAGLTNTLDELRERASPGQLFEQALNYARSSGGNELVRNLGTSVRDNPLPLLLIGAGIGWLMMSGGNRSGGPTPSQTASLNRSTGTGSIGTGRTRVRVYGGGVEPEDSMTGRASAAVGAARDSVASTADQAINKVSDASRSVADVAGSAADRVRDAAGAVTDGLRSASASVTERVTGSGQDVEARASELSDQTRQGVTWLMREQPLVLGAIGVALGAAVGALLPNTEVEDRLMGETRDAMADRVQTTAQHGYERLKDTAAEHVDHVKAAVGQAASGTGGVGSALTDAAREVRQAVGDAAQDLAGEARSAVEGQPRRNEELAPAPAPSSPRIGPV